MLFVYYIYKLRKFLDNKCAKKINDIVLLKQKLKMYLNKYEINYGSTSK